MHKPQISVVIASHNAKTSVEECLSALMAQYHDAACEIIVVDNSTDGTTDIIRAKFPYCNLVIEPVTALIPELWAAGIRRSGGDIVAITTAHFVPDQQWIFRILKAHQGPEAAVGGAIENTDSAGVVDWAVYFCRYAHYMLPFHEAVAAEIAGDNASYKRRCIDRYRDSWNKGFWEPEVHARLKAAGLRLLLTPSMIVYHKKSFGLWSFMRQRYRHGIQFGKARAGRFSLPKRWLFIALSPSIPFLFLARIARQVLGKGRHQAKLALALPVLTLFVCAWTLGEVTGYLKGGHAT